MRSSRRFSPAGPSCIDESVQWNTIRSGLESERSAAVCRTSSAIWATGRRHLPATRARVTKTPSPSGAKWLNCGSLIVLTAGMIRPTRARAAGRGWPVSVVCGFIVEPPADHALVELDAAVLEDRAPAHGFRLEVVLEFL